MNGNPSVVFVTAFGRGETMAIALRESGFDVQVLDFTNCFSNNGELSAGPFPVNTSQFHEAQKLVLDSVKPFERGLSFWLRNGPFELSGPMSSFYVSQREDISVLRGGKPSGQFESDWFRRFLSYWTCPYHTEPWEPTAGDAFPYAMEMGLFPANQEERFLSFERYRTLDYKIESVSALHDVGFESSRLSEILVQAGTKIAFKADQWVWCLSSFETDLLNAHVATLVFPKGVHRPEWRWLSFQGKCERGTWSQGFPEYSVLIGDTHLPWAYSNMMILRWLEADAYRLWLKVPAETVYSLDRRKHWAAEAQDLLRERLPLARWMVDFGSAAVCPNSLVYNLQVKSESLSSWRNWEWLAPETSSRLDLSSRLEQEATALNRLKQWRNDQLRKQGAAGDHALHAP